MGSAISGTKDSFSTHDFSGRNMHRISFKNRDSVDMTRGNILRHLIIFSVPLLVGNLFQQLYNTVDSWVVGNYVSNEAFSAVGTVSPIINLLIGVFMGFSSGASVVISQYFGAKKYDRVKSAVHTTALMTILLSVVFTIAGILMTPVMLRFMRTPDNVFPESQTYLTIYFSGMAALLIYNMGSSILRAIGDSLRPFYFLVACCLTNIALDFVFVLVFQMGVAGVAYATVISELVSAVLVVVVLFRTDTCVKLVLKELRIDGEILRQTLNVGIPAAFQMGVTAFSNVFVQGYINQFGADFMSGWGAYLKVDNLMFLPMQSVALAATTFVGQNLVNGDAKRAREGTRSALIISASVTAFLSVIILFTAPYLIRFFNPKEEVIRLGTFILHTITPFTVCCCINQVLAGSLRGAGNSRAPMVIMLTSFVVFRQIYLFTLTRLIGNTQTVVTLAYPAGWVLCSTLILIYYLKHVPNRTELNLHAPVSES